MSVSKEVGLEVEGLFQQRLVREVQLQAGWYSKFIQTFFLQISFKVVCEIQSQIVAQILIKDIRKIQIKLKQQFTQNSIKVIISVDRELDWDLNP